MISENKFDMGAIRAIGGSQHRAFEELGYQLLTSDLDRSVVRVVRTGDPDGGLEWYAEHPDGSVEGWQAKYIFDIATLLAAMTESVKTVTEKRPEVKRLTFVVPWNLPDHKPTKGKSARQKYNDKVEMWVKSIPGADRIEFELAGESDLLARLALPQHRGRATFFWENDVLGTPQLQQLHAEAASVAGRRYRPELQVDLPIQIEVDAAGFAGDTLTRLDELVASIKSTLGKGSVLDEPLRPLAEDVVATCRRVLAVHDDWSRSPASAATDIETLKEAAFATSVAISNLEDLVNQIEETREAAGTEEGVRSDWGPRQQSASLRRLRSPVADLLYFLGRPEADLLNGKPYFLSGDAGSGKTHLFLDACERSLANGRPSAVLFGESFSDGDLWPQLASKLGLSPSMTQQELLTALDSCGGFEDTHRFVLCIDALNETTARQFWSAHLAKLAAAIEPYAHIALAVSCRTTYLDGVDPDRRRDDVFIERSHPGLVGKEREATGMYFRHYGLEEPRHPLLTPEFTNPLFLQIYCESFEDDPTASHGHESRGRCSVGWLTVG